MSQALVLFGQEDSIPLPLTVRSTAEDDCLSIVTVGPGRILHNLYTGVGRGIEKKANLAAHRAGLGPIALTDRIEKIFGDSPKVRQEKLDDLYHTLDTSSELRKDAVDSDFSKLKKACRKLMRYALPSEAAQTQLDAFRSIILLTTRYTGLRKLFVQPECSRQSDDAFEHVWMRPDEECTPEWEFARHFAAACLSTTTIATLVEGPKPSELGAASESDTSHVDSLLSYFYAYEGSPDHDPSKLLAIRYLGGILEVPTFWDDENHQLQCVVVKRLCSRLVELIEDTGIGFGEVEKVPDQLVWLDLPGIDIISDSILAGIEGWMTASKDPEELRDECWVGLFLHLVELLESTDFLEALPRACQRATATDWEILHSTLPNIIYEAVDMKTKMSASDIPQSAEIEISDSASVADEDVDTVILVVGATGSGKSTFINTAYGTPVAKVGDTLDSCTDAVEAFEIARPGKSKLFLVDTPGFDDTYIDDTKIIKKLVDWLQKHPDKMLGGAIYLHEITLSRMAWGPGDHIAFAKLLCGDSGLSNVLLATTKWGEVAPAKGEARERELSSKYWQEMVRNGSGMARFNLTQESALEIIDSLLQKAPISILSLQDQQRSFIGQPTKKQTTGVFGLFRNLFATFSFW